MQNAQQSPHFVKLLIYPGKLDRKQNTNELSAILLKFAFTEMIEILMFQH